MRNSASAPVFRKAEFCWGALLRTASRHVLLGAKPSSGNPDKARHLKGVCRGAAGSHSKGRRMLWRNNMSFVLFGRA